MDPAIQVKRPAEVCLGGVGSNSFDLLTPITGKPLTKVRGRMNSTPREKPPSPRWQARSSRGKQVHSPTEAEPALADSAKAAVPMCSIRLPRERFKPSRAAVEGCRNTGSGR